jgi:hypothetical protein
VGAAIVHATASRRLAHGALWQITARRLWFIRNTLDADLYSPDEVALLLRGDLQGAPLDEVRQRLRDDAIRVMIRPATITEGFVFVPRVEGGRFLDVSLQGDAWDEDDVHPAAPPRELRFGFAVVLPDGDFDYERLDPGKTYAGRTLPDLDAGQLRRELERLPCCATDADGANHGDPLNLVLVGEASDVLNALTRSGWSFTHRITARSIAREVGAAITGSAYPVAPVSSLYALGRSHDVAMQRARRSISQRNHLRPWLAPFRFEGRSVWVGQVSRDIGVKITPKSPTLTTHVIDNHSDIDYRMDVSLPFLSKALKG